MSACCSTSWTRGLSLPPPPLPQSPHCPLPPPPIQHFIVRENEFTEAKFPRPIPPYPHDNCFGITEREDCPRLQGSGRRLH